jgi:hypothetical protein
MSEPEFPELVNLQNYKCINKEILSILKFDKFEFRQTKNSDEFSPIAILRMIKSWDYFKPLTNLVSFDLLFEALFLWITFFLAKRSSIEITLAKSGVASALVAVPLNFLMAFLVVLAWYLLRRRFAAFALILFIDDL